MFGQQKSPFSTGFSSTPTFTSTFGGSSTPAFGSTTTGTTGFGTAGFTPSNSTPFAFGGATGSTPFSFAGAQPQQQPQQQQPQQPFGASSSFSTGFGAGSPFGQTAQQAKPGLFGQTTPATTTPSFGGTTPNLFGQPSTASTGGIFGSQTQTASPFGQPSTASSFGQAQPQTQATSFSFAGASTSFDNSQGTGGTKYATTTESDQSTTTTHYAITAMPAYQKKSFEELRFEDYRLGRKGGSATPSSSFGTTPGPFGGTTFGGATNTTQPSTGAFGQASPFGGSTFGTQTQAQPTPAATTPTFGGGFGTTSTTQPFGAAPATSFGGGTTFGSTTFGAATPAATPAPTTSFGFGATNTTQPFGAAPATTPASPFGSTPSFGSLGASQPATSSFSTGTFGTNPVSPFGATTAAPATSATTSLFGATPSFGAPPAAASSSFAFPPTTTAPSTFGTSTFPTSTFGTMQPAATSLFSTTAAAPPTTSFSLQPFSATPPAATTLGTSSFASQPSLFSTTPSAYGSGLSLPTATTLAPPTPTISSNPYGSTPLPTFNSPATAVQTPPLPYTITSTPEDKKRVVTNMYRLTPRSSTRIKPRGYTTIFNSATESAADAKALNPDAFVPRTNIKSLVIEDDGRHHHGPHDVGIGGTTNTSTFSGSNFLNDSHIRENGTSRDKQAGTQHGLLDADKDESRSAPFSPLSASSLSAQPGSETRRSSSHQATTLVVDESSSGSGVASTQDFPTQTLVTPPSPKRRLPQLTKVGYYTNPKLTELACMSDEELSHVRDFSVGRQHFGLVVWHGDTDVRGLNLDDVVEFDAKAVEVYKDESRKPPEGQGLNKPATVILENVWPVEPGTQKVRRDHATLEKYRKKLEHTCNKLGAQFKSYVPETGEWAFNVEHFSRYGLDDEDESDADAEQVPSEANSIIVAPKVVEIQDSGDDDDEEASELMEVVADRKPVEAPLLLSTPRAERIGIEPGRIIPGIFASANNEQQATPATPTSRGSSSSSLTRQNFLPRADFPVSALPLAHTIPPAVKPFQTLGPVQQPQVGSLVAHKAPESAFKSGPREWTLQYVSSGDNSVLKDSPVLSHNVTLGRSFRVAFSPNGSVIRPSSVKLGRVLISPAPSPHASAAAAGASSKRLTGAHLLAAAPPPAVVATPAPVATSPLYVPLLDVHLNTSERSVELESSIPSFKLRDAFLNTKANIDFFAVSTKQQQQHKPQQQQQQQQQEQQQQQQQHAHLVWTLVEALWGGADENSKISFLERKLALTAWLKVAVAPVAEEKVVQAKTQGRVYHGIFSHLTAKQVHEAATLACRSKNTRLASLLAQTTSPQIQSSIAAQISIWQSTGAYDFVDKELLSLYQLLSGDVEAATALFIGERVLEDWRRCFALHMWYKHPVNAFVSDALKTYDEAVSNRSAVAPCPPYYTTHPHGPGEAPSSPYNGDGAHQVYDTTYQLLRLYAVISENSNSSKLTEQQFLNVVHPLNSTSHPMDYQLTWHLYTVLRSLPALRAVPDLVHEYNIHVSFASQLEMEGLWVWALYVLLHIPSRYESWSIGELRNKAVADLLARHVPELGKQEERFILDKLHIPPHFIQEAKAWYAIYTGQHDTAATCLKGAGLWNAAHDEVINHLTAKLLVSNSPAHDRALLDSLEALYPHYDVIQDWSSRGALYMEYLRLKRDIPAFKAHIDTGRVAEGAIAKNLMDLYKRACDLCEHIERMDVTRNKSFLTKKLANVNEKDAVLEGVCLAEMSTRVGAWMNMLHQCTIAPRDRAGLISRLRTLPIPPDYRAAILESVVNEPIVSAS